MSVFLKAFGDMPKIIETNEKLGALEKRDGGAGKFLEWIGIMSKLN